MGFGMLGWGERRPGAGPGAVVFDGVATEGDVGFGKGVVVFGEEEKSSSGERGGIFDFGFWILDWGFWIGRG